jgi:hypothetical protein
MLKWRSAELRCGGLAELADADGSKSSDRKVMGVQVPRPLPSLSIPFLRRVGLPLPRRTRRLNQFFYISRIREKWLTG